MGVLTVRPNVPRGTLRRNSETEGANDSLAKLSECPTWNIRRSPPLLADSFSRRPFLGGRKANVLSPGKGRRRGPAPLAQYSRFECSTWNVRMKMRSKGCGNSIQGEHLASPLKSVIAIACMFEVCCVGHWSPTIQWDV